ncbi:hypothetical protein UC8_45250 [Roseimaritima ulvae]|uniref:Uncharacterized protein n=1 Tax=Roseimaritima ulvae TaxID=980254 RepID=A0A5B9QZ87_9BACT|nr:hypothetical protein UC8_45250 [Roseimaritima ulvae]
MINQRERSRNAASKNKQCSVHGSPEHTELTQKPPNSSASPQALTDAPFKDNQ